MRKTFNSAKRHFYLLDRENQGERQIYKRGKNKAIAKHQGLDDWMEIENIINDNKRATDNNPNPR